MYPVLFEIFGFPISTFGVMVAAGFLAGGFLAARSFERAGLPGKAAWDMVTWCVVGGLVGAKLWYVAEQVVAARLVGCDVADTPSSVQELADYFDAVRPQLDVTPETREYYGLEDLWGDMPSVELDAASA